MTYSVLMQSSYSPPQGDFAPEEVDRIISNFITRIQKSGIEFTRETVYRQKGPWGYNYMADGAAFTDENTGLRVSALHFESSNDPARDHVRPGVLEIRSAFDGSARPPEEHIGTVESLVAGLLPGTE